MPAKEEPLRPHLMATKGIIQQQIELAKAQTGSRRLRACSRVAGVHQTARFSGAAAFSTVAESKNQANHNVARARRSPRPGALEDGTGDGKCVVAAAVAHTQTTRQTSTSKAS
jgi:hypothetical protein